MDQIRKGPGRPPAIEGRGINKCFRISENTEKMLEELMTYYGEKEDKERVSLGKVLEILIKEKYFQILASDYEE